jgi:hypothetical protein
MDRYSGRLHSKLYNRMNPILDLQEMTIEFLLQEERRGEGRVPIPIAH